MPAVTLNATAGALSGWFDKDVSKKILDTPAAQRDEAALAMPVDAVKRVGPGCQNALARAIDKDTPTVRDFLKFMPRSDAGDKLSTAAQQNHQGGNVVGMLFAAYNVYVGGLDGI